MLNIYCRNTHNAVKQTAALCLLKMLRVNPKAIPIDQHAAKIVQLINDKHLVSTCSIYNYIHNYYVQESEWNMESSFFHV